MIDIDDVEEETDYAHYFLSKLREWGSIITPQQAKEARSTLEFIKRHQEAWDQGVWLVGEVPDKSVKEALSCGTVACFAGWLAVRARREVVMGNYVRTRRELVSIDVWASHRLGLPMVRDVSVSVHPFHCSNTLEELEFWVTAMEQRAKELVDSVSRGTKR